MSEPLSDGNVDLPTLYDRDPDYVLTGEELVFVHHTTEGGKAVEVNTFLLNSPVPAGFNLVTTFENALI